MSFYIGRSPKQAHRIGPIRTNQKSLTKISRFLYSETKFRKNGIDQMYLQVFFSVVRNLSAQTICEIAAGFEQSDLPLRSVEIPFL